MRLGIPHTGDNNDTRMRWAQSCVGPKAFASNRFSGSQNLIVRPNRTLETLHHILITPAHDATVIKQKKIIYLQSRYVITRLINMDKINALLMLETVSNILYIFMTPRAPPNKY